ncbi:YsnF/AvaK domain-containing protein [Falsiroseomonas sp. HW251]|uniref:YsnF/AvaK domain-containing protein n=1 Tax=Falsiroseomonas sp. HW251 TaxID=3390998 RepID=UPI003D31A6C1
MSEFITPREARALGGAMGRAAGSFGRATERAEGVAQQATQRAMGTAIDTAMATSRAWFDLMLRMQRASLASLSVYSPHHDVSISTPELHEGQEANVLQLGEERLNVGTRTVPGNVTRIRRRVVAAPVEQEVTLRDEHVVVERRPAGQAGAPEGVLTETIVEMRDSTQVAEAWKSVHVAEEVVLRREVTERRQRVRETLKRDVLEVEQDNRDQHRAEAAVGRAIEGSVAEAARRAETEARAEQSRESEDERRRREAPKDHGPQGGPGRKG